MLRFLVDEDLPRTLAQDLNAAGFEAQDVRDVGLRGKSDHEIFQFAQVQKLIVLTADLDFSNILDFPLGSHPGIVVVRLPNEVPSMEVKETILRHLAALSDLDLQGNLAIFEADRVRLRKRA